jgi:hypothetical protein
MKQIIFILTISAMCLAPVSLRAQENLPYKPWVAFHGDTLQYLEYNYTVRQLQHQGKKVSEVLKELELPILIITETVHRDGKMVGISLGIHQTRQKPSPLFDYYIEIRFANDLPPRKGGVN